MSEEEICEQIAKRFVAEAVILASNRASAFALACAACIEAGDSGGIVIQRGHHVAIAGTPIGELVALADGFLIEVGAVDACDLGPLEAAFRTSDAGVLVARDVPGLVGAPYFVFACRDAGRPVIIEADQSTDWTPFFDAHVSLVTGSASVVIEGNELGMIAGAKTWIDRCSNVSNGLRAVCRPSTLEIKRFTELFEQTSRG